MTKILVIAELAEGNTLKNSTFAAISFAKNVIAVDSGDYDILVLGHDTKDAAAKLTAFGAGKVLTCDEASLEHYLAEHYAPTIARVAADYELLVAAASSYGKDLMPRVAARLGASYAGDCSNVTAVNGELRFERPMFAGNALGYCVLRSPQKVATVRQSEIEGAQPGADVSPLQVVEFSQPGQGASRVEFVSLDAVKSERPELTDAKVVVCGGRALKEKYFEVLEPLADKLGAALGASRAAVDAGYCPGDFQVGQTGKIVAPDLYFAIGISGAIQHLAGMKGSKVIVAINKDAEAPIFQVADYGLVADLFDVIPELVADL